MIFREDPAGTPCDITIATGQPLTPHRTRLNSYRSRFLAQSRRTPLVRYLELPDPPEPVAVYLHAFNFMNAERWTNLENVLQTEPRLKLKREA